MKAIDIIKTLDQYNKEAYFIGGHVRDMLLGIESLDEDISTIATPDELEEIFINEKIDKVGKSFLVTLINGIDVATFREDYYTNTGHCEPKYAVDLYTDVCRRDLTINAIAFDPINKVFIDYFDGIKDLDKGIVRFVGDGNERIKEDPVRMIRACRFVALLSNNNKIARLSKDSFKAIKDNKEMIREVAPERIQKEIMKVMTTCDEPSVFFIKLYLTGLLDIILPELSQCFFFSGGNHHTEYVHEHLLATCDALPKTNPILRVAGLLHDIGKVEAYDEETHKFLKHEDIGADMSINLLKRLKFTTKEIETCYGLIKLHMSVLELNTRPKKVRKLMSKCLELKIYIDDLLLLKFADREANIRKENWTEDEKADFRFMIFVELMRENLVLSRVDLKVDGNDMMKLGFKGTEIKGVLEFLTKSCISNPKLNERKTLISLTRGYR